MLTLVATIASVVLNGLPADQPDPNDPPPRHQTVFVAPMGIYIPLDHNGLAFMVDAPSVAIDMFEPDAEVALSDFAHLSQQHHLLNLQIGRDGGIRSITLDLPGFPMLDGEAAVRYLLIKPDGSVEFAPMALDSDEFCRLILTTDPVTGGVTARCVVIDCDGKCELVIAVLPDGSSMLNCFCLEPPPGND
ncbi:MAG: hypothetical protein LAT64_07030 [Phycisphaerales bacterium]|nr:hypothetical protein [Planctomycetota bacterium]MCH8508508.1 hypothetical protein [Phycisphaerales bacterium]